MKKFVLLLISILFSVTLFCITASAAPSATASISLSSKTVTAGDTVTVTVKYTSQNQIGSYDFLLKYDANLLQYVSGADVDSANGTLKFANYNDNSDMKTVKVQVKFKALSSGSAKLSTQAIAIVDYESFSLMSAKDTSSTLTVNPPKTASSENKLSSLTVSGVTLSPEFKSSTYEYSAEVEYSVKKLAISAIAKDKNAKVSISSTELGLGENKIEITVTAENGSKRKYTLKITRKESTMAHIVATVEGNTYTFAHDPDTLTAPFGFAQAITVYQGKEVLAYKDEKGLFTLCYLIPQAAPTPSSSTPPSSSALISGSSSQSAPPASCSQSITEEKPALLPPKEGWYLYNEADESFVLYTRLDSGANGYVAVPIPSGVPLPEDLEPAAFTKNELSFNAFTNKYCTDNGLIVLYLRGFDGTEGFKVYDEKSDCYYDYRIPETVTVTVTLTVPATTKEAMATNVNTSEDGSVKTLTVFAMAAFSMFIILLIVFIAVTRSKNSKIKDLRAKLEAAPVRKRISRDPKDHFTREQSVPKLESGDQDNAPKE